MPVRYHSTEPPWLSCTCHYCAHLICKALGAPRRRLSARHSNWSSCHVASPAHIYAWARIDFHTPIWRRLPITVKRHHCHSGAVRSNRQTIDIPSPVRPYAARSHCRYAPRRCRPIDRQTHPRPPHSRAMGAATSQTNAAPLIMPTHAQYRPPHANRPPGCRPSDGHGRGCPRRAIAPGRRAWYNGRIPGRPRARRAGGREVRST